MMTLMTVFYDDRDELTNGFVHKLKILRHLTQANVQRGHG